MSSNQPKTVIATKKDVNIPEKCENLSLVFYKQVKSSDNKEVIYAKEVSLVKSKFGEDYDFYSVKAGMYGIRIPSQATHWCIAILGAQPQVLYTSKVPAEMSVQIVNYAEGRAIYFNRFRKNAQFLIGLSQEAMKRRSNSKNVKKVNEKLKLISDLLN